MRIQHKLILSYLLVALLSSGTTLFTLWSYKEINNTFAYLIDSPTWTVKTLNDLKESGLQIASSTSEYAFIHSEGLKLGGAQMAEEESRLNIDGYAAYETSLNAYEKLAAEDVEGLESIRTSGNNLVKTSREFIGLNKRHIKGRQILAKKKQFETDTDAFLEYIHNSLAIESQKQAVAQADVRTSIDIATKRTFLVTGLTFLLAIFSGIYISFLISRRIRNLQEASQRVGNGEFETQIEINSKDEVGELSRSFNRMIGSLKESRDEILTAKRLTDNIIGSIANVVFVLDMDLNIVRVNRTAIDTCKFAEAELVGQSIKILHPDGRFFDKLDMPELQAKGSVSGIETYLRKKDGGEVPILFSASLMLDVAGSEYGIVCVAQDITERKSLEEQLTHQALHDPLTKLANRVLFRDRVEHAIKRTGRKQAPVAVLFLDLDGFKSVNDSLGHAAGDALLISVTERLQTCLRTSDSPARLGGDEFAVLVEDIEHADEASFIAERIRTVLSVPFSIGSTEVFVSTSIGIAISANQHENPEELLRNADVAMYMSKTQGKNRCTVFENEMHDVLVKRIRLECDMRSAIDKREFEVYYQPIIDLQSDDIMGMEALIRWNHPEHGLISPLDFIPLAEETGLILPLGQWILEEACLQAREWQIQHEYGEELSITVNIASRQFQEHGLLEAVEQALAKSHLPPRSLILEIPESTMIINTETTIIRLNELRELGIRFAIDDFGTGYSSLSYLQLFPVDILKIDKSFIDKIALDKEGAAVAKAIITMSETLHFSTIAEGIESDDQQTELQKLGCELGQGFHFAKPLRAADMTRFLRRSLLRRDEKLTAMPCTPNDYRIATAVR